MKCAAISDESHFCEAEATHRLEWSDRVWYVCDIHVPYALEAYDNDHEYDKTGVVATCLRTGDYSVLR